MGQKKKCNFNFILTLTIKIVGTLNVGVAGLRLLFFRLLWDSVQRIAKDAVLHPNQHITIMTGKSLVWLAEIYTCDIKNNFKFL